MNWETKLQICAGLGAVLALPLLYIGLKQDTAALAVLGLAVFGASMLVTPVLRLLPTPSA